MTHLRLIRSGLLMIAFCLSACSFGSISPPPVNEKTIEVVVTQEVIKEIIITQEVEKKHLPLFWDEANEECTKTIELTIATYGDHQSRYQDSIFGMGMLQNSWEALQPCVNVETQPIPQGASSNTAEERWTAGTNADVVFAWFDAQRVGVDHQWVLPLERYFDYKNPYSENATWYEDFLFPEDFYIPHADGHTYSVRPGIHTGSHGQAALFYNKTLLENSGVPPEKILPQTWSDWFDNLAKCKAAGKTGMFLPLAGSTLWEYSNWMVWWMGDYFSGDLAEELYTIIVDGSENPQGTISTQKLVRAVIEGKWTLEDPRAFEFFEVSKKLFDTIQPGFEIVPDLVGDTPAEFVRGNACYAWAGVWRLSSVGRYPNLPFIWGTVWLPRPDVEFSEYATGHYNVEQGSSQATAEVAPLAISAITAQDADVLAAAIDFAMYITSPGANQTWCQYQYLPCSEPGQGFGEITAENPGLQTQLYGFFNPPRDGKYIPRNTMLPIQWLPGGPEELNRRFIKFYTGATSKEDFIHSMMTDIIRSAKEQCQSNLEAGVSGWEFCRELPLD
jgi:ABC-type glycerol-3-phosphate transport system substrate-binding protein